MKKYLRSAVLPLCSVALLAGCLTMYPPMREETAKRIAMPVFMYHRTIDSQPFQIRAFERVHAEGEIAHLYIAEGNGPWRTQTDALDPTPKNPVSLKLASEDGSPNVIYLGQPCQYMKAFEGTQCDKKYWTTHNFSPEVLDAYNSAIDEIKRRYRIPEFHIIGHDTGGTIASLIAAERGDILSLRTVAGVLDTETYAKIQGFTPSDDSANPADLAEKLQYVPQRHFIGRDDLEVTSAVHHKYALKINNDNCMNVSFVDNASHDEGWQSRWPSMLSEPVECKSNVDVPYSEQRSKGVKGKTKSFSPAPAAFHDAKK